MAELAPGAKTATGDTWGGVAIQRQHFSGTDNLANGTTLATGVGVIVAAYGWTEGSSTNDSPFPYEDGSSTAQVYVDTSNNLKTSVTGGFLSQSYAWTVEFTEV